MLARSTPAPPGRHTARSLSPFCPPPSARVCRACSPPATARTQCPYRPCRHALCCDPRTGLPLTRTAGRRIAVHDRAGAVHQGPCLTDQAGCGIRLRRRRSLGHRPSPCAARVGLRAASIARSERKNIRARSVVPGCGSLPRRSRPQLMLGAASRTILASCLTDVAQGACCAVPASSSPCIPLLYGGETLYVHASIAGVPRSRAPTAGL